MGWSSGQASSSEYAPQPQMSLYPDTYPVPYVSLPDNQFTAVSEGYLKQPIPPTSASYSYPGLNQPVATSYARYPPSTNYTDLTPSPVPYTTNMHQRRNANDGSPMTSASGASMTPVTPTSQADGFPLNNASLYGIDFTQAYDNPQAYAYSTSSVNHSGFFRQNYPSS